MHGHTRASADHRPTRLTDDEALTIAFSLTGLLYERRVTEWAHILKMTKG